MKINKNNNNKPQKCVCVCVSVCRLAWRRDNNEIPSWQGQLTAAEDVSQKAFDCYVNDFPSLQSLAAHSYHYSSFQSHCDLVLLWFNG